MMGPDDHNDRCPRFCKTHWYYDFGTQTHAPYPAPAYFQTGPPVNGRKQWGTTTVFVGPPAYYPKGPSIVELANMQMQCPHTQTDLTCNTCLRHMFRPLEIR